MRVVKLMRGLSLSICSPVSLFLLWSLLLVPHGFAAEAEQERMAKLVEEAKKEGKVTYYTVLGTLDSDNLRKKFQAKYPFIKTEVYRSGDQGLATRILSENRAGRHIFDVVTLTGITTQVLKRTGIFAKYFSPHREFYPPGSKDPEGYWTDIYLNLNVMGYNTKFVSPGAAPKTYEDLLDPKWKGKMGMDAKAVDWFAHLLKIMGEEKGMAFMKRLAEQNIQFRIGRTLNAQMVAAGEVSIGITLYNNRAEEMKGAGAPIEWVPLEPVVPEIHPLALSAHAAHPNAAKLLYDFILSREGQEIIASSYRIPSRNDVDPLVPRLKKGFKILPYDVHVAGDYERYAELYREIFMKKRR